MATKGLLARKIGMTQVFSDTGELLPVTVLEAGPCVVVARRTTAKEGYEAVQLGFGDVKEKQLRQRMAGQLGNARATSTFLTVVRVDLDRNLLLLRGAVPGHPNSLLVVRDARQRGKPKK